MKRIVLMSIISSLFATNIGHADSDDYNCSKLHIMITNLTRGSCELVNPTLKHGFYTYSSSVPTFIPAGTTAGPLILEQSVVGPELELTYVCGEWGRVTFNSKQNFCFFSAGDVSGQILSAQNTAVDYLATNGNWLWSQPGSINWRIR